MFPRTHAAHRSVALTFVGVVLAVGLVVVSAAGATADDGHAKGKGKGKGKNEEQDQKEKNSRANDDSEQGKGYEGTHVDDHRDNLDATCRGDWAEVSSKRPAHLQSRGVAGLYVWHDGGHWNVYATHTDRNLVVFQGTVRFDAPTPAEGKSLGRDSDILQRNLNGVDFVFKNYGDLDGVRFKSSCASTITVSARINGQPATIFAGRSATPVVGSFLERRTATPTVPSTLPTVPPTTAPSCIAPAWNPAYFGAPGNLRRGGAAGLYVWLDGDRLRIETTRPNTTPSVISGVIAVNAPVLSVTGNGLGANDFFTPALNGATFSFANTGDLDGLELRSPCATQIIISATIDGQPIVAQQIWIGRNAINATSTPVVLAR